MPRSVSFCFPCHCMDPSRWQLSSNCSICGAALGKIRLKLRHHCRSCGRTVCSACSPHRMRLEGQVGQQRACNACSSGPSSRSLPSGGMPAGTGRSHESVRLSHFTQDDIDGISGSPLGPFDPLANIPGEEHISDHTTLADVLAPAWSGAIWPVYVEVTNYRLKMFEPSVEGSTLVVTLCSGHRLKAADMNGLSDPYALLSVNGGPCKRSSTKARTLNPVWNETFVFVGISAADQLQIRLFDKDQFSADDPLGSVCVPFTDVDVFCSTGHRHQRTLRLPVCDGVGEQAQGYLQVRLRCSATPEQARVPQRLRHCSIPLLSIAHARLDVAANCVQVSTKAAEQFGLYFQTDIDASSFADLLLRHPVSLDTRFSCLASGTNEKRHRFSWHEELSRWVAGGDSNYRSRWQVNCEVNKGHRLCETYSEEVVLPAGLTTTELETSAAFRTKGRFPQVVWVHSKNGACLARCSQPKTGVSFGITPTAGDCHCLLKFAAKGSSGLTICDARPFVNAEVNRMKGGGTESDIGYNGCHVEFLNIGNIHDMAKSINELREALCQKEDYGKFGVALAAWLSHVSGLLRGAMFAAGVVESGESVVVHCSDGWDRTSQVVSLASLMLDARYRTIAGFADLVEKDWLLPGHKFQHRNGLASREEQERHAREESPIFLQFLDCVAQLWHAYPQLFEYSVDMLSFVLYHSLSGRYSTFLGNCERERATLQAQQRGGCLWMELRRCPERWRNAAYDPAAASAPLVPCHLSHGSLAFCEALYAGLSCQSAIPGDY